MKEMAIRFLALAGSLELESVLENQLQTEHLESDHQEPDLKAANQWLRRFSTGSHQGHAEDGKHNAVLQGAWLNAQLTSGQFQSMRSLFYATQIDKGLETDLLGLNRERRGYEQFRR